MLLYPEVQRKAQAELDRICIERLPDFDDYDSLPYIEAIFLEALRWNPVVPEGSYFAVLVQSCISNVKLGSRTPYVD